MYRFRIPLSRNTSCDRSNGGGLMHRSIDCSTWDDPWFTELPTDSKLMFLYLITNRRVSQCGAMEITVRQMAFETGLAPARITPAIEALGDRVQWWSSANLLIVRNFYRHQRANTGDKFDIAARKSAENLPDFARAWLAGVYPHLVPDVDTHGIPTPHPHHTLAISEAEAEAEAEAEDGARSAPPPDSRGARIPSDFALDDALRTWATGKGFSPSEIDHYTEAFVSYWRAESGARARKKDWRQAWQTWLLRETPGKRKALANGHAPPVVVTDWNDPAQVEAYRRHVEQENLRRIHG